MYVGRDFHLDIAEASIQVFHSLSWSRDHAEPYYHFDKDLLEYYWEFCSKSQIEDSVLS